MGRFKGVYSSFNRGPTVIWGFQEPVMWNSAMPETAAGRELTASAWLIKTIFMTQDVGIRSVRQTLAYEPTWSIMPVHRNLNITTFPEERPRHWAKTIIVWKVKRKMKRNVNNKEKVHYASFVSTDSSKFASTDFAQIWTVAPASSCIRLLWSEIRKFSSKWLSTLCTIMRNDWHPVYVNFYGEYFSN